MENGPQCLAKVVTCIRYKQKKNAHAAGMVENWVKLEHNYFCAKFLEEILSLTVTITVKNNRYSNVSMPKLTAILWSLNLVVSS